MPVYAYKALNAAGKNVSGALEAESTKALRQQLRKDGLYLVDAGLDAGKGGKKAKDGASRQVDFKRMFARVSTRDLATVTRQLAVLTKAGIPLVDALTAIIEQTENDRLKRAFADIKEAVNEGASLADAMSKHPKIFNSLYINMVRSGESSGALDTVLSRLTDFTEKSARLKTKVSGTLAYPIIMVVIAALIIAALFVVVIPKVTSIFDQTGQTLPINTRILIWLSTFMRDNWLLTIGLVLLTVWGFLTYIRSERGMPKWHAFTLRAPIFGGILRKLAISRFAGTLATLLRSGVPLLASMDIVKAIVGNKIMEAALEEARESIKEGESIAAPLKRSGQFYPIVTHMIAIGERSGQLEEMLDNVATAYEEEVDTAVSTLTSLLEPLMIVGMGSIVAFIVFSILMPILQMNEMIAG